MRPLTPFVYRDFSRLAFGAVAWRRDSDPALFRSRNLRRALQLTLKGHEVHQAADGQAGLELVAAVDPDVVVIDVGLPVLDGYETT